jgi:hypothetical protein
VTKRINPKLVGLKDRQAFFKKAFKVFTQHAKAAELKAAIPVIEEAAPAGGAPELSGPQWVSRFPTSRSIDDLAGSFAPKVTAFVDAMKAAGAAVVISATYRPKERAYLMHWAWDIAKGAIDPASVPPMAGVNINWVHDTLQKSKKAARDMVAAYAIVSRPSLNSKHTERLAIDMTISWSRTLAIRLSNGSTRNIASQPRNGGNPELVEIGRGYGVVKLPSDPPHWSDDGR